MLTGAAVDRIKGIKFYSKVSVKSKCNRNRCPPNDLILFDKKQLNQLLRKMWCLDENTV